MSNTNKDQPKRRRFFSYFDGNKVKLPKEKDTTWHWLQSTPSWWTRLMMNRPQRRKGRLWEASAKFTTGLEEEDPPMVSKKPHKYFW